MSDDPTEWFRERGERRPSDAGATSDGRGDEQPPTERIDATESTASASGDGSTTAPVTQPLDAADRPDADPTGSAGADGLSHLFGDQRDYAEESDWLPPRDPTEDAPTRVQPTAPATDPLGWLGEPAADDATTVALGASGAGLGAAAAAPPPTDDSVTQRFDAAALPPLPSAPSDGAPPPEEPGSKRLVIALAILGSVLVIALVLALIWFFSGTRRTSDATPEPTTSGSASASATPTPTVTSASPTATATTAPAPTPSTAPTTPAVPAPTIGSFTSSPTSAACESDDQTLQFSFSWTTSNATKVSISIDGVKDPYNDQLSAAGTLSNVPFQCSNSSQGYTLLATNSAGRQTSKQVTVTREDADG